MFTQEEILAAAGTEAAHLRRRIARLTRWRETGRLGPTAQRLAHREVADAERQLFTVESGARAALEPAPILLQAVGR